MWDQSGNCTGQPTICTSSVAISSLLTVLDQELEGISDSEVTLAAGQEILHFFDEIFFDGILIAAETLIFVRDSVQTVLEDGEGSFVGDVAVRTGKHDIIVRLLSEITITEQD